MLIGGKGNPEMRKKSAKTFAALVALIMVPALMTGCLVEGPADVPSPSAPATATLTLSPLPTAALPTAAPTPAPTPAAATTPDAAQKALLVQIRAEAEKGKTINCEYPLKSNMTAIEDDWGAPDFSEYVAAAKGEYALYETRDTAFGFNKGAQVFEVRSFDERLGQLRLSAVKNEYGAPPARSRDAHGHDHRVLRRRGIQAPARVPETDTRRFRPAARPLLGLLPGRNREHDGGRPRPRMVRLKAEASLRFAQVFRFAPRGRQIAWARSLVIE